MRVEIQARQLVAFNKWATLVWILLIVPTLLWWKDSILWIGLMSIWANIASHFAAWIAARAEHKSEQNDIDYSKTEEKLNET